MLPMWEKFWGVFSVKQTPGIFGLHFFQLPPGCASPLALCGAAGRGGLCPQGIWVRGVICISGGASRQETRLSPCCAPRDPPQTSRARPSPVTGEMPCIAPRPSSSNRSFGHGCCVQGHFPTSSPFLGCSPAGQTRCISLLVHKVPS